MGHVLEPILCGLCHWVPLLSTVHLLGCVLRTEMGMETQGLEGMTSRCGAGKREGGNALGPSPTPGSKLRSWTVATHFPVAGIPLFLSTLAPGPW